MPVAAQSDRPELVVGAAVCAKLGRAFGDPQLRIYQCVRGVLSFRASFSLLFLQLAVLSGNAAVFGFDLTCCPLEIVELSLPVGCLPGVVARERVRSANAL